MASWQGRKVWAAGDKLGAADLDALVDQSAMVFATDAARTTAIPSPTEGMISFQMSTDRYEWYTGSTWSPMAGAMPYVVATSASQTLTTATDTVLTVSDVDNRSFGTITNSSGVFTCSKAGIYSVSFAITYATNVVGERVNTITIGSRPSQARYNASASAFQVYTMHAVKPLTAGQTITVKGYQSSGGNLAATNIEVVIAMVSS